MIRRLAAVLMLCLLPCNATSAVQRADGQLVIDVVDSDTQRPIAARMHLKSARGRPVKLRLPIDQQFADHFYIDGQITLPLARGQYTFEIDAGPEYFPQTGHFEIDRRADDQKTIEMRRAVDLAKEGWWAGDLDVLRRPEQLPLAQRAEAVHIAPTREQPTDVTHDSLLKFDDRLVARTPFAWDFPVWLARGELDAIQVITPHQLRDDVVDNEGDGRPRDRLMFPSRTGNGRWAEMVYFQVLNCGLRIPPAAGSGTGENDSPLGTNRTYVYCGDEFTPEAWWDGLEAGRVFATNGPLLRTRVHGEPPGYVFRLASDEHLKLEIGLNLATRDPVEYLEIIKNGVIEREVTTNTKKYQLALSGPYYVERAGQPRVCRASVQFFLDWIDAATAHWRDAKDIDDSTRASKLARRPA
ncbi:MAG TPA: hypothetical protein PJ982_03040 [Lacipirellulaceae bacterium]|nr:hypothetical protein [Lacipirellulaceae bacterium]